MALSKVFSSNLVCLDSLSGVHRCILDSIYWQIAPKTMKANETLRGVNVDAASLKVLTPGRTRWHPLLCAHQTLYLLSHADGTSEANVVRLVPVAHRRLCAYHAMYEACACTGGPTRSGVAYTGSAPLRN